VGLRLPRSRAWRTLWAALAVLGPGVITGAAGDDAGGVATYASIGAQYGYSLLWVMGPITVALVVVQVQVARMALVTGKGFAELIREEFGVRWTAFAMLVLLVANGTVTVAEFAGIAAAGELFGIPRPISVPIMAVVVWLIVVRASYTVAEKIFILLSTALLTYVGAAILARPDWSSVGVALLTPSFVPEAAYLSTGRHDDHAVHAVLSAVVTVR
jgi:Mn2+/Fe2+ NRAMP family transporter